MWPDRPTGERTNRSEQGWGRVQRPRRAFTAPGSLRREGHGAEQGERRLPAVEPGVLHHDRHVGFDHAGVVGAPRDRFGTREVIEPQVSRALALNNKDIRPSWRSIRKVDRDLDPCLLAAGIEDAYGLVTGELARAACAGGRDVAFRNRPDAPSDRLRHGLGRVYWQEWANAAGMAFVGF